MGRYALIKAQTNVAVSWVVETARAHGMYKCFVSSHRPCQHQIPRSGRTHHLGSPVQTIHKPVPGAETSYPVPPEPTKKPGRLKGEARIEAKKATHKAPAPAPTPAPASVPTPKKAPATHIISTHELLRQAVFLSALGESLVMLKRVWCAFKEAIRGLQKYAGKFATEQPAHEGNHGHVYFLDVLQKIVETLQLCVHVQATTTTHGLTLDVLSLSNLFASLSTETDETDGGDDEEAEASGEPSHSRTSNHPPPRYKPKIHPEEGQRLLWVCFFEDTEEMYRAILMLWTRYFGRVEGAPTLSTATFLTEVALEHVKMLEETLRTKSRTSTKSLVVTCLWHDAEHRRAP
jgi:hypothetical protein